MYKIDLSFSCNPSNDRTKVRYWLTNDQMSDSGKGRLIATISFEPSTIDYRYVRFNIMSFAHPEIVEDILYDFEEDTYLRSKRSDNGKAQYLKEMQTVFQAIGDALLLYYKSYFPPQKNHIL